MEIATRIIDVRDSGVVITVVRDYAVSGVAEATLQFELFATGTIYHEVPAEEVSQCWRLCCSTTWLKACRSWRLSWPWSLRPHPWRCRLGMYEILHK
jgi:hypothetical protein